MNIEIVGIHHANKGALLMLEAIRARLGPRFPDARFAVPMTWTAEARLAHGVWLTPGQAGNRVGLATLLERAPWQFRNAAAFIPSRQIDVLLDASGFGYGDFWGLPKLRDRLSNRLKWLKKGGRKAILLPQALGPFRKEGMADAFREALDRLDLSFVRDDSSAQFVEAIAPGRSNVRRAPDFTNLLHPELPRRLDDLRGRPVVIPNEKMVTGKPDAVRTNYLAFLHRSIDMLRASGRDPFILVHEGTADRALARQLNDRLDRKARVVDEPSALVTKAVIGVADLAVSSRFHGLVSALSSAVPSLACGWSHKYRELMADYGCPDLIVDLDRPETWDDRLAALIASANDAAFRTTLRRKGNEERAKSEAMWTEVEAAIQPA